MHNKQLNDSIKNLPLKLGLLDSKESVLHFTLSGYSGDLDIIFSDKEAMDTLAPKDPGDIHIREINEDSWEKIKKKFKYKIRLNRLRHLRQALTRALEVLNFLFEDQSHVYIVLQEDTSYLEKDLSVFLNYLKGPKVHGGVSPITVDYFEEPHAFNRVTFHHAISKIRLKSLLKKKISMDYAPWKHKFRSELYFILDSNKGSKETPVIINIYDDRGMSISGPFSLLNLLKEKFKKYLI